MMRALPVLVLLAVVSCTPGDPLAVEVVRTEEVDLSDGLSPISFGELPDGWTVDDGIYRASAPATLPLLAEPAAYTLAFAFRGDTETRARLLFGNGAALDLPGMDLSTDAEPTTNVVVSKQWQQVEVAFQPSTAGSPALLVAAYLNGNLLYCQEELPPGEGSPQATLEVTAGTLSITNLRGLDRAGKSSSLASNGDVELHLPLIRYAYYPVEGDPSDVTDWGRLEATKEGYIGRFDLNAIRDRQQGYAVRFTSQLDIPRAGEYTFSMFSPSSTRLYIDDQLVIDRGGKDDLHEGEGSIRLSEGTHALRLDHYQYGGWNRLNLTYSYGNQQPESFNDMPSDRAVAVPPTGEVVEVDMDDRPYLLRSFLNYPPARIYDFTDKRTHVVNVGQPTGAHYSYDLQTGSLLQVWRGRFVDVSEMWVGRGEPQVARALGSVVALSGLPQWSDSVVEWSDDTETIQHQRYELDGGGQPTFHFRVGGNEVSDRIVPAGDGLQRTLANDGSEPLQTHLATAVRIRELGPGSFELVQPGLSLEVEPPVGGKLRIVRGRGLERLVAEVPGGQSVSYRMNW